MRGKLLGSRYRIQNRIGEGGMAFVYLAIDEKLGRKVAIKVLHKHMAENEDIRKRFYNEARAISTLDHRNILKIFDFSGQDSKELWIVTEILKGLNLNDYVSTFPSRWLHPIVAACICREILNALSLAHAQNIVHRDIKPENIMILDNGLVKLMDFGIAKNLEAHSMTLTGTFMGSPSYMSPEQIRGRLVDSRSDLYSLGVLFYEIVTGKLPFIGSSTHDVVIKICEGVYKHPRSLVPNLPADVNDIIVKAMSKHPGHRYQEARTFGSDLETFLKRNDFEESHIELERYFTDREKFIARLRKLDFTNSGSLKKPVKVPQSAGARTTQTKHTQLLKPDMSNLDVIRQHNENAQNKPLTKTSLGMIANTKTNTVHEAAKAHGESSSLRNSVSPRRAPSVQIQPTYATAQGTLANDLYGTWSPKPKRRRALPRAPKRNRPVQARFAVSHYTHYQSDWFSYVSGAVLVAIIGVLAILGFWRLQSRLPNSDTPRQKQYSQPSRPQKPALEKIQTPVTPTKTTKKSLVDAIDHAKNSARKTKSKAAERKQTKPKDVNAPIVAVAPIANPLKPVVEAKPKVVASIDKDSTSIARPPKAAPLTGKAEIIVSSIPAAEIYIDGRRYGTTIDQTSDSGWLSIASGKHELELRREGFATYKTTLQLKPGQERRLVGIRLSSIGEAN